MQKGRSPMSDRILFSIGEALIDMIPSRVGCSFDEVPAFSPRVGGAPANVCAAVARLGGRSALLSQLGDDPFGHKIARALAACGVELSHLEFTSKASTALAFVSLAENGERTFSFCTPRSRSTRAGFRRPLPCIFAASHWWTVPCATPIWLPSLPRGRRAPSSALTPISVSPSGRTGSSCARPCGSFSP